MLLKEENKGLKIIKFVVIGFVLVFAGVLTLSLFPPMIFLILAGLSLYNIIREKNKSEQLRRVCTYAVNARILSYMKEWIHSIITILFQKE